MEYSVLMGISLHIKMTCKDAVFVLRNHEPCACANKAVIIRYCSGASRDFLGFIKISDRAVETAGSGETNKEKL